MSQQMNRSYVGLSKEQRMQHRKILLIETAMNLSDEMGWHQLNVDRLCQEAKLNKRYFYESFENLDQFSIAVVDHLAQEILLVVAQVMSATLPLEQMAYQTIEAFVNYVTEVPSRARLIFGALSTHDQLAQHRKRLVDLMVSEVSRNAREIHQPINVSDSTIQTCALFLIGGTGQVILNWLDISDKVALKQLIDEITTLWLITGNGSAQHARALSKIED